MKKTWDRLPESLRVKIRASGYWSKGTEKFRSDFEK
jgi:hypothetical protein